MALPNSNITTTLVGQTLGTSSRDVGTLFLHENVNEWGFNLTGGVRESVIQEQIWGVPSELRQRLSQNDTNYAGTGTGFDINLGIGSINILKIILSS